MRIGGSPPGWAMELVRGKKAAKEQVRRLLKQGEPTLLPAGLTGPEKGLFKWEACRKVFC